MTKDQIKRRASGLYLLASECGVAMAVACTAIDMSRTTPHRWLNDGAEPQGDHMVKLRQSILTIAAENKTLPKKYQVEVDEIAAVAGCKSQASRLVGRIKKDIATLEKVLGAE